MPSNYATLRVWRDTTVANGGQLDIAPGILGYEWDTSPDDNPASGRPHQAVRDDAAVERHPDRPGQQHCPRCRDAQPVALSRPTSGSLVFGAGTIFWTWALSDQHDSSPYGADIENVDIQQFTINMFADMGIQPGVADAFLISQGLKRASASTDTTAAVASINDLPDTVEALSPVTITGTATDNDGNPLTTDGRVAAVEVSVDGGNTWKVANSADNWATWSFYWYPTTQGAQTIKARAIDDSLNVYNITPDSEAVTVTPSTTFSAFSGKTPGSPVLTNEATTIELGMRFAVDRVGSVTELKYWRGSGDADDTDVREGHLWRADGTLLATVIFTSGRGAGRLAGCHPVVTRHPDGGDAVYRFLPHQRQLRVDEQLFRGCERRGLRRSRQRFLLGPGRRRARRPGRRSAAATASSGTAAARRSCRRTRTTVRNYWVDITFDARSAPENSAPGHHLGRGARPPRRTGWPSDDHRDRRRRQPAHLLDRRRRRRRALHHRRADRRCCASSAAELRGADRRGRQQRLRR